MPPAVKGSPEEREKFMAEVFRKFYQDPANAGKEMSIGKANVEFRKKYGSMLRNKKAYEIRTAIKAQIMSGGRATPGPRRTAFRVSEEGAGGGTHAALIEGTPEQLEWFQRILPQLIAHGLAQAKIEYTSSNYAVLARI